MFAVAHCKIFQIFFDFASANRTMIDLLARAKSLEALLDAGCIDKAKYDLKMDELLAEPTTTTTKKHKRNEGGKGTFDLLAWWRANAAELAPWVAVLRAVLAHSPNSCPPERVFSILNGSFDDDQDNALSD